MNKHEKGFSIVAALFILVVLSAVVGFATSISAMTRNKTNFAIQGTKAYFAASSGLEWALYQVTNNSTACPAASTVLYITQGGIKGFKVTVECSMTSFTEGTYSFNMFNLLSTAEYKTFGDPDYVSRELKQISIIRLLP